MELFYDTVCGSGASCDAKSLSGTEWLLVFTCVAIIMAQRPNLNSIASVSFIAAITAVGYYSLIWVSTIPKDRLDNMSRDPLQNEKSHMTRVSSIFNAFGIIALSFRGHNLVLEIQVYVNLIRVELDIRASFAIIILIFIVKFDSYVMFFY